MVADEFFYIGSDNTIKIRGLHRQDGTYVNAAVMTGILKDRGGAVIADHIPFEYVFTTNGDYQGSIGHEVAIEEKREYHLFVVATLPQERLTMRIKRKAAYLDL